MQNWLILLAAYVLFSAAFRMVFGKTRVHDFIFALINMLVCFACFFLISGQSPLFIRYLGLLFFQYLLLRLAQRCDKPIYYWLAIMSPVIALALIKIRFSIVPVGFSYLSFRMLYLAYELYTEKVKRCPGVINYFSYAFFPLTFMFGPISAYERFEASLKNGYERVAPYSRCLGRIFMGIIKCYFLSYVFKGLSFESYWKLSFVHSFSEFTISGMCTAMYVYLNFSGICDMMIGAAGIMGIRVDENFNNPFAARNLAEFWGRWHMTLTRLVREVFYMPILITIGRITDNRMVFMTLNAVTALTLFALIGLWHGKEVGYLLFGLMHGIGVIGVNLYGMLIQRASPSVQNIAYHRYSHIAGAILTFLYVSYSAVFFGADMPRLRFIFQHLLF